jgi:hypothetical protein
MTNQLEGEAAMAIALTKTYTEQVANVWNLREGEWSTMVPKMGVTKSAMVVLIVLSRM